MLMWRSRIQKLVDHGGGYVWRYSLVWSESHVRRKCCLSASTHACTESYPRTHIEDPGYSDTLATRLII